MENKRSHARRTLLGIKFDDLSIDECVPIIESFIDEKTFHYVAAPDMHRVLNAINDERIRYIYENADLTVSDGTAVVVASRLLGSPLKQRVPCSDLSDRVLELSARKGYRIFLFRGGAPEVTEAAVNNIRNAYPAITIVGAHTVPYEFDPLTHSSTSARLIDALLKERPQIVLFSLGFPKEEQWIWKERENLKDIPLCLGIGGTMEIYAGRRRLAPQCMRRLGLEWLYRVLQEPKRLWKRYLIGGPLFVSIVIAEALKKRGKKTHD